MTAHSKIMQRVAALARRDALAPAHRADAAQALAARAFPLAPVAGIEIAGYWPIRSELDPRPLMRRLAAGGARLSLPVVIARDAPLAFRRWREGDALSQGAFGIGQPPPHEPEVAPDVLLVPLAAFDRRGHRIGYGAGHYDRTLAAMRGARAVVAVGLAFAAQEVADVAADAHDVALDLVLTENETLDFRSP
jgi:5-formyltetrahydrofolate cyclo-ligase